MINKLFLPILIVLPVLLLTGCSNASDAISGWYLNKHRGILTRAYVSVDGEVVRIALNGGHVADGPIEMASTDCEVIAEGKLENDVLVARFVDTPGEDYPEAKHIRVEFGKKRLTVVAAETWGYCGLYSRLEGVYSQLTPEQMRSEYLAAEIVIPDEFKN